jgi:hypothetical protein
VAEDPGAGQQPLLDLLDVGSAHAADIDPYEHLAFGQHRDRDVLDL